MDRGYIDFERLSNIDKHDAFFVIRAKNNLQFTRISSNKVEKSTGVMCDQQIILKGFYSIRLYKNKLRRVKFYDAKQNRTFANQQREKYIISLYAYIFYQHAICHAIKI